MENKRLNILFISSWYPNKYKPFNGIFIKRHAKANAIDCNISAIFICSGEAKSVEESVEDNIYTIRGYFKTPQIKFPLFYQVIRFTRYILMWKKVLSLYRKKKGKPDLINSNIVYPVSIIATLLRFLWNVPYVITEHWTGYFPENGKYSGFIVKQFSKIAVRGAGAVITDSFKLSRTMPLLGLKNRYFSIPNVVDPAEFQLKPVTQSDDGIFTFIHVSSLDDRHKNINGMIRTFKKFRATHPNSKLIILWEEDYMEFLDMIKEPYSEEMGIFLIGKQMGVQVANYLRSADAFVLFSNYENLPCVMLESFCCGVPVIGTKVGDVPDYINEKNGVLVDIGNEIQLLAAMEKVFKNKTSYNPEEIRNQVLEKVSPRVVSRQFTEIYKTVLGGK